MRRILSVPVGVLAAVVAVATVLTVTGGVAGAHTEADLVAVPAGSDATVTFKPTHGCGSSPTVEVRIRAEVAGATAGEVDGWTATATPEGDRTVLAWTGGLLPADATGEFPVEFTVPDSPGTLLLFPAIQICENGDEMAWIDGDPEGDHPAPRLLILPADYEPAGSIDEVPADAPGRDQLVAIVDVDNPSATTVAETTVPPTTAEAAADAATTTQPGPVVDDADADVDEDDDSNALPIVLVVVVVVLAAGGVAYVVTQRRRPNG